jgi:hypothetical protein
MVGGQGGYSQFKGVQRGVGRPFSVESVGGTFFFRGEFTTFLAERVGAPLNSDLRPTMDVTGTIVNQV